MIEIRVLSFAQVEKLQYRYTGGPAYCDQVWSEWEDVQEVRATNIAEYLGE